MRSKRLVPIAAATARLSFSNGVKNERMSLGAPATKTSRPGASSTVRTWTTFDSAVLLTHFTNHPALVSFSSVQPRACSHSNGSHPTQEVVVPPDVLFHEREPDNFAQEEEDQESPKHVQRRSTASHKKMCDMADRGSQSAPIEGCQGFPDCAKT